MQTAHPRLSPRARYRSAFVLALCVAMPVAADVNLVADARLVYADTAGDALAGDLAKTRFDSNEFSGLVGLDLHHDWELLQLDASLLRYPDTDAAVAVTEAFLTYRPIPSSAWRQQFKAGFFYAPLSLENSETAWLPRGFLSSSTINTWIAEELRTIGIEWKWSRLGQFARSDHDFDFTIAMYDHNDPTGSLLSWRGWASHDRQIGWGEEMDYAALPIFSAGGSFRFQEPYAEPFMEVDHRIGFYAGIQWRWRPQWLLSFLHYDNRGEPYEFDDGHYSWYTEFDHIGWRWQPNADWTLQGQWLEGYTEMGRSVSRYVDNEFESQGEFKF